ncbi:hypothetical protein [Saccharicrinis fermentans]|nr:hypothetical protein [Saccharicrinis fermentans]
MATTPTPTITYINDESKEVAGIQCKKAMVQFDSGDPFEVFYTNDIHIDQPNRHTPFRKVPGVLMEFHIDFNGIRFLFKASDISYDSPKKSTFNIPEDATPTPEKEIEALILTMIESFQ